MSPVRREVDIGRIRRGTGTIHLASYGHGHCFTHGNRLTGRQADLVQQQRRQHTDIARVRPREGADPRQRTLAVGRGQFIAPEANMLFTGEVSVQPEDNVFLMRRGEIVIKFMPDEGLIERPHLISITLINPDDRRSLEEPAMIDVRLYNSNGPGHIDYNRRLFLLERDDEQTVQIPVIPTKADWHRVRMNVTTPILIRNVKIGAIS